MNAFLVDGCPEMVSHHATLLCGDRHHIGPVIHDVDVTNGIEEQFCGECGRLIGRVSITAHDARNSRQYRFIPVR